LLTEDVANLCEIHVLHAVVASTKKAQWLPGFLADRGDLHTSVE